MSKKQEDLSGLTLEQIMKKYQEMEAMASYYEGKVKRMETKMQNKRKFNKSTK